MLSSAAIAAPHRPVLRLISPIRGVSVAAVADGRDGSGVVQRTGQKPRRRAYLPAAPSML